MQKIFLQITLLLGSFFSLVGEANAQPDIMFQPFIQSAAGLSSPMELVDAPGDTPGRFFIVEKSGTIRIWDGTSLLTTPFLDISAIVRDDGERGLLSMAFHPNYATNGYFFVYYNDETTGNVTVARYQVSGDPNIANAVANPSTPLISIPKPFDNHNGGHLQFRTEAGSNYLYFATGDGGSGNDPNNNAQNPASWLGKMIRMNVDLPSPVPELWAWGLRNPFRWSFDKNTGDIWIGDVGQGAREEIDFLAGGVQGANYGWVCMEGKNVNVSFPSGAQCDTVQAVDILPVLDYINPSEGRSVVGGYVYRGTEFPSLQGYYLATDYFSGNLWFIKPNGASWDITERPGTGVTNVSSISQAEDGSLYAVALSENAVYKLVVPVVTPVILSSFSGKSFEGYNLLLWTSQTENNIDHYTIEYSSDGSHFKEAGELASFNNGNATSYSFQHNTTETGLYYRLRINELNREFNYSAVIRMGKQNNDGLKVYPSVIHSNMINIVSTGPVQNIVIISSNGRRVFSKNMNGMQGYFMLTLPSLPKGMYLLQVSGNSFRQTEKIFIE